MLRIYIYYIFIILSNIYLSQSYEHTKKDQDYPYKFRLNNGNYIVIIATGIFLYNPSFSTKIEIYSFNERLLDINEDSYPTTIAQFLSDEGGYVICLVKNKIYLFSKNGDYITYLDLDYIKYYDKISYSIIPHGNLENDYYFDIITREGNKFMCRKYKYNSNEKLISFINYYDHYTDDGEKNNISCEWMYYSGKRVIFCLYGSYSNSFSIVFNIDDFTVINGAALGSEGGQIFKTNTDNKDRAKAVCCSQHSGDLKCYIYNIDSNSFGEIFTLTDYGCDCEQIDMMVEYFPERDEFVFWCVSHYDIYIGRYSNEEGFKKFDTVYNLVDENSCEEPKRFNLVYSSTSQKYVVLTDTNCQTLYTINSIEANKIYDYPTDEAQIVCPNYYNYERDECFETIPPGYYQNDTSSKIIYKCHDNCETCNEGPSNDNNNCLTCVGSKFYDLGNCVDNCINGHYTDTDNITKCKCTTNIACEYCSKESKNYNLCISCNKEKGYYPILNDGNNIDSFVNCYNNVTIFDGYYLDIYNEYYDKCYSTCKKCNEVGDGNNNKCTECISTHEFKNDFENDYNCYEKCNNYYYFDSSKKFYCVSECPNNYNKLIESKKKCISDCRNDEIYKYAYENKCYDKCSNYYIYDLLECFNEVSDGYYHNDTSSKIIYKCHDNCKTCQKGPSNDNNNCLTCINPKYYDLGNCVDNCNNGYYTDINNINKCKCSNNITCKECSIQSNEYNLCISCNEDLGYYPILNDENNINPFINCYNNKTILDGYFLNISSKYYEKCYSTCKKCNEVGDENNNKCTECFSTHEFKNDFENDFNCYEKCNKYYYYDTSKKYYCVNECPLNYSLLQNSRCVENCSDFSDYKFEYEKKCYNKCPSLTHISKTNEYLCIADLICPNTTYYSYDLTECINTIPDGYYCNDTDLKTIDKCHENCKTCNLGPSNDNNNCLTCNNSRFYELGNCVDNCINGFYNDTDNITKCKCSFNIKCFKCSNESNSNNLCISCNNDEGYYEKIDDEPRIDMFVNCYKDPEGYYLDNVYKIYNKCYLTCKTCNQQGDESNNNCIKCKSEYEHKIGNNCYEKCNFYYYFDSSNNYQCTDGDSCPMNYKLILSKKKCIDACSKDNNYKYEYEDNCYDKCPNNTIGSNITFICEEIKKEEPQEQCKITTNSLLSYKKNVTSNDLNPLTEVYAINYRSSNDYVSTYKNDYISLYIYKNITCLENTTGSAPQIDFGDCYQKVKDSYDIEDDLIISIIIIDDYDSNRNSKPITTYAFSDPLSGKILNSSKVCANEKIVIQEDIKTLIEKIDDQKEDFILFCTKQGIDVFNITDRFYNDLCYHFESPNGRDVPLKDRISMFYPNITLCDHGCENKGVDLETLKAKCVCAFNDLMNNELFTDNVYGQSLEEIMDIISSLNIAVVQCIKDIFNVKYFSECTGAYIFLFFFVGEIICLIKYFIDGLYDIRKFLFALTKSYIEYISKEKLKKSKKKFNSLIDNFPPKKNKRFKKSNNNGSIFMTQNQNSFSSKNDLQKISTKRMISTVGIRTKKRDIDSSNKKYYETKIMPTNHNKSNKNRIMPKNNIIETSNKKENEKININIKEYLSLSFDENDFDDVIDKETRTFCQYFSEKFQENQIFINSFYIKETFRPNSLKILTLIMTLKLYFVVNALFYTEEYISEILYIEGKDSFFAFAPRRFNHFIYIYAVVGIMSYAIGYFFLEERKIKKMFIRNREGEIKLKFQISNVIKGIKSRFISLISINIFLSIISFIYISCFNIVYPKSKFEWIKSSLFIFLVTQFINFSIVFIESIIRYTAIKCNSEKFFKLSLILN